jgi:starch phosphorylase
MSQQAAADKAFVEPDKWIKMSILSAAASGRFSSDRTIREYAERTWKIDPCQCPF